MKQNHIVIITGMLVGVIAGLTFLYIFNILSYSWNGNPPLLFFTENLFFLFIFSGVATALALSYKKI